MPDEVREQLTKDQRSFLHPESLQTLYIPSSMYGASSLQFTSLVFYRVQVRGLEWHSRSLVLCQWPIFVLFLRFVFGLLFGWKIQTWPIIRFITESVTCWFFYLLVFDRIHDAMCLNKMSRTSNRTISPQHQKYSSIFHCTTWGTFYLLCSPNPSWVFAAEKLIFLFNLTIEASPIWWFREFGLCFPSYLYFCETGRHGWIISCS